MSCVSDIYKVEMVSLSELLDIQSSIVKKGLKLAITEDDCHSLT